MRGTMESKFDDPTPFTPNYLYVKPATKANEEIGMDASAHDLPRACAKLCRKAGGHLEQINFLLGHSSGSLWEWAACSRIGVRCHETI